MMKLVKWLLVIVVVIGVLLGATALVASYNDGPMEIFAGGPFTSGELHTGPAPDWTFLRDRDTVEFQSLEPARSRTTWILEHEGRIYIPCGYMTTTWGRMWKKWPIEAQEHPEVILRVDGVLYDATLRRVTEGPEIAPLLAELGRKYTGGPVPDEAVSSGYLWLFELAPR